MRKSFVVFLAAAAALSIAVFSCETISAADVAAVADIGAQTAAAAGAIDQNTADAIGNSSQALASAAEEITPEQEYYIGRAVGANILTSYKVWNGNPALTAYVNRICNAIVINSPRPELYNGYHVMLLDSGEINAFATSGGHIFITRGLVACANSEDALAGVIAHEIAHIQLQHSIKAIKTNRITHALLVTGASTAGAAAGYNVNELTSILNESVSDIVSTLVNNGYSQQQEFDADSTALKLLASAGYNPSGLIDMLKVLDKNQSSRPGGFNRTHPTPARRIASAERYAGTYRVTDTSAYRRSRFNTTR
jgi:predicted Zn-dependent protease